MNKRTSMAHETRWPAGSSNGFSHGQPMVLKPSMFREATFAPVRNAIAASRPSTNPGLPLHSRRVSPARLAARSSKTSGEELFVQMRLGGPFSFSVSLDQISLRRRGNRECPWRPARKRGGRQLWESHAGQVAVFVDGGDLRR